MSDWVLSVGAVVLLTTVSGYIIPEGKLGKYVKGVFSILVLLVIIRPVINFDFSSISYVFDEQESEMVIQGNYLEYVFNEKTKGLEKGVVEIIKELDVNDVNVVIIQNMTENYGYEIKNVNINLKNAVINSDKEHINIIKEIKKTVSKYLNISEDLIDVVK